MWSFNIQKLMIMFTNRRRPSAVNCAKVMRKKMNFQDGALDPPLREIIRKARYAMLDNGHMAGQETGFMLIR